MIGDIVQVRPEYVTQRHIRPSSLWSLMSNPSRPPRHARR